MSEPWLRPDPPGRNRNLRLQIAAGAMIGVCLFGIFVEVMKLCS